MLGEVVQEESTSEMFEEVIYENNTVEVSACVCCPTLGCDHIF